MLDLWPEGPDLDPCWEEGCHVQARQTYDIRRGEDGRLLPWHGRVYCNGPFSDLAPWAGKSAAHGLAGGEVLFLSPTSSDSRWWHEFVLSYGTVCMLGTRSKFWKPGAEKPTPSVTPISVTYFGADPSRFVEVFGRLGTIVRKAQA